MGAADKNELFQDVFEVTDVDPHGKKFDKVSRILATSDNIDMQLTLDVNSEVYPMQAAEKFTLLLATSLLLPGTGSGVEKEAWRLVAASAASATSGKGSSSGNATLADEYDYVMHGKVYKYDDAGSGKAALYASFGGLLMCLAGDYRQLQDFNVGQNLYLLIRK